MKATSKALAIAVICAGFIGCGRSESSSKRERDARTPAGRVGEVAYGAAKVTGKVAQAAGKELSKAAHEAHEGWKEAAEKDKKK